MLNSMKIRQTASLLTLALVTFISLLATPKVYADSERIRSEFFNRLKIEKDFGPYELEVDARRGIVTITGNVANEISRARLTEIAEAIAGVDTVDNKVTVAGRPPVSTSGASIATTVGEKIISRAKQELTKESYSLQVAENDNEVILKGSVGTTSGSEKIARIARESAPHATIRNQLVITEEVVTDEQIKNRVLAALKTEPLIKSDDLKISVDHGIVEIEGVRPNHREIDRILSVVVMVDGVRDVRSRLRQG